MNISVLSLLMILSCSAIVYGGKLKKYTDEMDSESFLDSIYDAFFGEDSDELIEFKESEESAESEEYSENLILTVKNLTSVIHSAEANLNQIPNIAVSLKNLTKTVLIVQEQLSRSIPIEKNEDESSKILKEIERGNKVNEDAENKLSQIPKLTSDDAYLKKIYEILSNSIESMKNNLKSSEKSNSSEVIKKDKTSKDEKSSEDKISSKSEKSLEDENSSPKEKSSEDEKA